MYKIQTLNKISPLGLNLFGRDNYEVASEISNPDAILLRSYKLPPDEIPASVKAIARAGAGVNNVPVTECTERGLVVFNTPGANANSVKELVIAGLLLSSRRIHEGINWIEAQKPDENIGKLVEKEKSLFAGGEIRGKRLGIVGLGAIGVLVANAAIDLGMEVYGYDPFISVSAAWGLSSRAVRCESLDQMLGSCDYVTLHVPLNDETRNLINAERLKRAKKGLRILNFSRDALVDSSAVTSALESGVLAQYVTDFPVPELLGVKGVLSIPHLGASTTEAEDNCAIMAAEQLKDFLETGNIRNSVNFPACSLEPSGGVRLLVANENVPNMLSQILTVLAEDKLNVDDMVNRHRNGIAYNIIDLSTDCLRDETIQRISSIRGVIMTRQICL